MSLLQSLLHHACFPRNSRTAAINLLEAFSFEPISRKRARVEVAPVENIDNLITSSENESSSRHQSLQGEMAQHILPLFRLIVQIRLVIDLKIHFQMK